MAFDPIARGLVAAEIVRQRRLRVLDLLAGSIAAAGLRLPSQAQVLPTIGSPAAASAISGGTTWQVSNAGGLVHAGKYSFVGGAWNRVGPSFPNSEIFKATSSHVGNGTDPAATSQQGPGSRVRFTCAAPAFELYVQMSGPGIGGGFRLKVDGETVYAGVLGNSGNGQLRYIPITWGDGSAANRVNRHYELEFGSAGGFLGIRTTPLYKPQPWPQSDSLRIVLHGDSMLATVSDPTKIDSSRFGALGAQIGELLGQPDTISSGVGGSGWIAPASHDRSWFNERVDIDVIAPKPDVVIEMGGGNDAALNPSQAVIQPLVESWLERVISARPECLIFMTSPLIGSNPGTAHLAIQAAKQAAAARYPRNAAFIDTLTDPWVFGTGRDGAPAGNGNRDWVTGQDGAHPTSEGHTYLAGQIVRAVANTIPLLGAAQR